MSSSSSHAAARCRVERRTAIRLAESSIHRPGLERIQTGHWPMRWHGRRITAVPVVAVRIRAALETTPHAVMLQVTVATNMHFLLLQRLLNFVQWRRRQRRKPVVVGTFIRWRGRQRTKVGLRQQHFLGALRFMDTWPEAERSS